MKGWIELSYIFVINVNTEVEVAAVVKLARLDPDAKLAFHCVRFILSKLQKLILEIAWQ